MLLSPSSEFLSFFLIAVLVVSAAWWCGGRLLTPMMDHITVGNDLTRDHGFSTWLTANLPYFVGLQIGFTRSYGYNLNTVSFGVGFDPLEALRHRHEQQ